MKDRDTRSLEVVNSSRIFLTKEHKAELQRLINAALDEQDKITRHRCAEAVNILALDHDVISAAHNAVMNSGEARRIENNRPALTTDRYPGVL